MSDEEIFTAAKQLDGVGARSAYLEAACADDLQQKQRIEALLAADGERDSLLDAPFFDGSTEKYVTSNVMLGDSIGPYKLLQRIGEGGFGVVFMAEQRKPVIRRVALKIIKPGMDSRQVIARFEAERQALAMMDHPNIAKVLDAGTTEAGSHPEGTRQGAGSTDQVLLHAPSSSLLAPSGRPYFVMELVHGVSITRFCDDQQLTPKARLELFIPVCQAIQHAHQKGIIHRDIKPSNILVSMYDGRPVPKVIDFGVAKAIQQRLTEQTMFTQFGQVMGTLEYMSPEQAEMNQLDIDTRADVYSLGAVLYELLTGTPPFERSRLRSAAFDEILRIIREEEPPRPSLRLSSSDKLVSISAQRKTEPARLSRLVHGELDWMVMKALEKQRSRRYETASGLAKDIERYLAGEPITAAAPSASYRVRKFVRRHGAAIAVAATIAGLLVAGTIISSIQWLRAEQARAEETTQRILAEAKTQEANDQRRRAQEEKAAATLAQQRAERLAYTSAMALAPSDWQRGSLTRLQQTLDETASYPDRGFEWYYWQAQLHQEGRTIYPHVGQIWGVRLAADQRDIIVDTSWRSYRLDAGTGKVRAAYGQGPMSTDGRWLADGPKPENGTALIDTTNGVRTAVHIPDSQWKLALSPDGKCLLTADHATRTSHMWDVATSTQLYEINLPSRARQMVNVQFSPDGQWIADVVYFENRPEIELRRASDGAQVHASRALNGHAFAFTPDSQHLARWDAATEQIHLHGTSDLSDVKQIPCEQEPWEIEFSPDGSYLGIMTRDNGGIVINDVQTGRSVATYRVNSLSGIAFSHDGHNLIVCSSDGAVKFFPVDSGDYIQTDPHWGVQFSGDGSRLLTRTFGRWQSQLIDVNSRKVLAAYPNVSDAAIFPDGRHIATAAPAVDSDESRSTTITIADDTGKEVRSFPYDNYISATDLEVAPDGRRILVASEVSCSLLDALTGETIFERRGFVRFGGGFSPDGREVALWFDGESLLQFYDATTGRQTGDSVLFEPEPQLKWVRFSPDGKRIVTSYEDEGGSIYGVSIYDLARKERFPPIIGHAGPVNAAYFLPPDGRRLVTKSSDGTVRLWDVENGFELLSLRDDGYNETLLGLAVEPRNGRMIAISGSDGVFLKKAATPEQVAAWQRAPTQPPDTEWWKRLGGIQDWLVLAPFHLGEQEEFADDLDNQQLEDEAELDPAAGELALLDGEKLSWQRVTTSDCVLHIQKITSPDDDYCLAYAVTHIYSDAPREGVRLLFGSDDLAKVYLNGQRIHEFRRRRPAIPADDELRIDLRKGKNVLVCKVIDQHQEWGVSAQVVGEDYRPIPGVTTGLEP